MWPFPHLCIEDFLPRDLYNSLVDNWPDDRFQDISKIRPVSGYKDRFAWHFKGDAVPVDGPWLDLYNLMHDRAITLAMLARLGWEKSPVIDWSAKRPDWHFDVMQTVTDSLLVRDKTGYSIGPHTDAPQKVCSGLLYLPDPMHIGSKDLGTSIYVSRTGKTCPGGPHHDRDSAEFDFEEVWRVPYKSNTFVCFLKTDNSFHGVEPVPEGRERRVYIWNVRTSEV